MSKEFYDFKAKRRYRIHKPEPVSGGLWHGDKPCAFREYVDGKPQPSQVDLFDHERTQMESFRHYRL